jgi:hypothetical protein
MRRDLIGRQVRRATLLLALLLTGSATVTVASIAHESTKRIAQRSIGAAAAKDAGLRAETRRAQRAVQRRHASRHTAGAKARRASSRSAYRDVAGPRALAVATRSFELLRGPLWQGPDLQPGDRVKEYLGDHSFVLDQRKGPNLFVESLTPLRAKTATGRKPIDLRLVRARDGYVPRVSPTQTRIAARPSDGIRLGRTGISFAPVGASAGARPRVVGDKVFFANTATDADFIAAALPDGVETFVQLRSPRSSEDHALRFRLPRGARLQLSTRGGHAANPGAEVVRGKQRLATVMPPTARDAQGRDVATRFVLNGDTLTVHVDHRAADHAYPILVDPIVREEWWWRDNCGTTDFFGWRAQRVWEGSQWNFYNGCSFWGSGLYIWTNDQAWTNYQHEEWGEWVWQAYPNTAVVRADFGQINHVPRPVEFGNADWTGTCTRTYIWSWAYGAQGYHAECGALSGHWDTACTGSPPCAHNNTTDGNAAVFNYQVIGQGYRYNAGWAFLGAAILTTHDWNVPRITGFSGQGPPSGWVENYQHTFGINTHDDGLGVKEVLFDAPGISQWKTHGCNGSRHWRCPYDWTTDAFSYNTAGWGEGAHNLQARVWDVVGNPGDAAGNKIWNSPANRMQWQVKIDRTAPSITTSGDLRESQNALAPPNARLRIDARDGDSSNPRSGVASIEVKIDGVTQGSSPPQTCGGDSCPLSRDYVYDSNRFSQGTHTVTVTARDRMGHASSQSWQFRSVHTSAGGETRGDADDDSEGEPLGDGIDDFCADDPELTPEEQYCGEGDDTNENVAAAQLEPPLELTIPLEDGLSASSTSLPPGLGSAGTGYGLSTNPAVSFADPRLRSGAESNWLGLKRARLIVRWDAGVPENSPYRKAGWPAYSQHLVDNTTDWFAKAKDAGFTSFLVSFDGGEHPYLPTRTDYLRAVEHFVARWGDPNFVREYTAWNEPNHGAQPTKSLEAGAKHAGWYFKLMSRVCDQQVVTPTRTRKRCMVAAGDFAEPVARSYFDRYVRYAGYRPRAWAYHIYNTGWRRYDANGKFHVDGKHSPKYLDWFLKATATKAEQNPNGSTSAPPVWLTEQGPRYDKYKKYLSGMSPAEHDARAVEDTKYLLNVMRDRARIRRFNYYAWYGWGAAFDSGMVEPSTCRLRPVYYTYKSRTNPKTADPDPTPPPSDPACPF